MKKMILALLLGMVVFTLSACSSDSANSDDIALNEGLYRGNYFGLASKEGSNNEIIVVAQHNNKLKVLTANENTILETNSNLMIDGYPTYVYFDDNGFVVKIE